MPFIRHAVIMAAGRGQRMMPLTSALPKPMAPFMDTTLIAHGIEKIRRHVPNVHVTVGYKGAMLAQHLIEHAVSSVINTDGQPNSWWIYNSLLRHLDEPVYVLTCDNITELDFALLENDYRSRGEPACMLVPVTPVAGLEGDYIFNDGPFVTDISRARESASYCSGIQVLNPRSVRQLTEEGENFYSVWRQLIEERQLLVSSVYPKKWIGVETMDDLHRVNQLSAAVK